MTTIARHRTAMTRSFLSRPLQLALGDGLLDDGADFFDYGCGKGGDVRQLRQLGYQAHGWDPSHASGEPKLPSSVVNIGFVVNVIEDPLERARALEGAWVLARDVLVVAARLDWEPDSREGKPFRDGILTKNGTFQKYYSQDELRAWIDATLGQRSVAAAPGIFYVFRSPQAEQRLLARHARRGGRPRLGIAELVYQQQAALLDPLADWIRRNQRLPNPTDLNGLAEELIAVFGSIRAAFSLIRRVTGAQDWVSVDLGTRRRSEEVFEANLTILQPLIDFLSDRGRLPHPDELAEAPEIIEVFGSVRGAFSLIRRVTGAERWQAFETRAKHDYLVYLALSTFGGRPRFSELPMDLQYDTRDLFGTYKEASAQADRLLFGAGKQDAINLACRVSTVGKLTAEALYVHVDSIGQLPAVLRVYVGCAETLTGTVEDATLLKIHRLKPQVSFLVYPTFDKDPHPALTASIVSRISQLTVSYKDFSDRDNPPILHRKETFVPDDYPGRDKFAKLTRQEERAGLLDSPTIGTKDGWNQALRDAGYVLRGHRLLKAS